MAARELGLTRQGLAKKMERLGLRAGESAAKAPLPDYATPGVRSHRVATFVASAAGLVVVVLITLAIGRILARFRPAAPASRREPPRQPPSGEQQRLAQRGEAHGLHRPDPAGRRAPWLPDRSSAHRSDRA